MKRRGGGVAMLKGGGHKKFWDSFYTVVGSFSHIKRGRGPLKVLPCLEGGGGGGRKRFWTSDFLIM